MTTTITPIPTPDQSPLVKPIVLANISWYTYESILKDLEEQPGFRLTYNRGLLEIMPPLAPHEGAKKLIGRFIETVTEETDRDVCSLGSLTCKRKDILQGFEADQCYYLQNESLVWDKEQIDLDKYPPPDLVVEIDITSSSIDKFELYTAFRVPEVWRYDDRTVKFYILVNKTYLESDHSLAFPFLQPTEIAHFLALRKSSKETPVIKQFRAWLRDRLSTQG